MTKNKLISLISRIVYFKNMVLSFTQEELEEEQTQGNMPVLILVEEHLRHIWLRVMAEGHHIHPS